MNTLGPGSWDDRPEQGSRGPKIGWFYTCFTVHFLRFFAILDHPLGQNLAILTGFGGFGVKNRQNWQTARKARPGSMDSARTGQKRQF